MYLVTVVLLLAVLPLASIGLEVARQPGADLFALIGRWFVFWPVGVRPMLAAILQIARPALAADIFDVDDPKALPIMREAGLGNVAIGALGLISLVVPAWTQPAALVGALFYGLAGLGHLHPKRTGHETIALVSDAAIAGILLVWLAVSLLMHGVG